jgi:nicotinamidase-related amidase
MTINQSEKEYFTAKGFGTVMGFGRRPAVLVIDLLYAFTDPKSDLGSDLTAVIQQTNRILDAARAGNRQVIFSTVVYEDEHLRDAGLWALKQRGCKDLRPGSRAIQIDEHSS